MKNGKIALATLILLGASGQSFAVEGASASSSAALTSNVSEKGKKASSDYFFTMDYLKMATLPGFSMGAPAGMVPSWGVAFASFGGITNSPSDYRTDGSASVGFGIGDAKKNVGGAVSLGIGSINPTDGGSFNRGNIGLSLGHFFTKTLTSVAVGGQSLGGWNAGGSSAVDPSYYAAVTQILPNNIAPVIVNAGIGTNSYFFLRSTKKPTTHIAPFGSVAVYVLPQVSLIADYTSGVASAGASIVPVAAWPITVNVGAWDVFKYAPNHDRISLSGSVAYAYVF
ncbi:hypothetical protein [Fangia hongkongensis]|uniref:hypothetical protein n=1 Tax=Fangia hongkongensis TaxID=270495 RepID=UPI0003708D90|nr:hypothetical protein [Fangia hongkongensis]MBK2123874.1 hypothetical protein [Fangia hongkongensis]